MARTFPPRVFAWCILSQGIPLFWKASEIISMISNTYVCVGVDQWFTHYVTTWFFTHRYFLKAVWPEPSHHGVLDDEFFLKAFHCFGRPQTSSPNIYAYVGVSTMRWFNYELTLPHGFSLRDMSWKLFGQSLPYHGFLLVKFFPKAYHCFGRPQALSPNSIWLCGSKFYGVLVQWWTCVATWFSTCRHFLKAVWPEFSNHGLLLPLLFFPKAYHCFGRP